ncbi:MAG: alpha-mannosidase, partial [Ilumatobacter sp.]|nr:alpha-mannosidase [Ilumatobacter sp.]
WNKQNRFPHHTFFWEGLDGTRVLTHFPPVDTYNAQLEPHEIVGSLDRFREHAWSSASLMPFGHGDGGGGPTREMLEQARRLADVDPRFTLEIGSSDDFFRAVEREVTRGAPVPVWRGELYFETHRGTLTSQLRTKLGNRRCERLLVEAELWAAASEDPDAADGLDDLWREVLTQQFHDILPGSSIAWVHADAEEVFARVGAELDARITALLERALPSGRWLTNSADVPIDGVVVLPDADDMADGQRLADGTVAVQAVVPALGVAPVVASESHDRVVVGESSMANGGLAVRWDALGNLTSLIDIARRREVLPTGASGAVLELAPDHPVEYDAWDLESWTRDLGRPIAGQAGVETVLTVDDGGPLVGRVRAEHRFGPSTATVTYELRAGEPQLFVHVDVDWQHDEHLLSIAFPIDVRAEVAACDVQLGVVNRPTHPSSPWDAAKFEVCAHRFVDLSEPDFGVAVLNDGRYGHCVFGGAVRVSLARAAKYPDPTADHGRHAVTLAVRPHGAGLAEVRAAASRLNGVLRVIDGSGEPRDGPRPLVEVTGAGVEVDAVKWADDRSGDVIVRLHEALGNRVAVAVRARHRIGAAARCDLLESELGGEEVTDGIVALTLRPFQLVTLRLRFADDFDGR